MKLIDANVLIYALGREHEYRQPSIRIMQRIQLTELKATISTEVLQEILHFFRKRDRVNEGVLVFDSLVGQFPEPLPILGSTARSARGILERNPTLQARDAIHAAVVFEYSLEGIISADRAFDKVKGLRRFDPKELAA